MTAAPLVSVVMLSHNHAHFLEESIQSIVSQTLKSCEFIIIDNYSTDNSWEIITRWAQSDPRIKPIRTTSNLTIAAALNIGIQHASGEFIARNDSDDVWLPQRLEKQINFMSQPGNEDIGVCGSFCLLVDPQGNLVGQKEFPATHPECLRAFWYRNPFCHTATLVRKQCFERYGGYDESYNFAEDLDLWCRFGQDYRLANVPEYLVRYRILAGNVTLRKHRSVIKATLQVRQRAVIEYGYTMNSFARASYVLTWCMQWLPRIWVHHLFYRVLLKKGSRLWRSQSAEINLEANQTCQESKL